MKEDPRFDLGFVRCLLISIHIYIYIYIYIYIERERERETFYPKINDSSWEEYFKNSLKYIFNKIISISYYKFFKLLYEIDLKR